MATTKKKGQGKIAGSVYTNISVLSRLRECTNDGVLFEMKFKNHMVLVKKIMLQIREEKQSIIKAVSSNMLNKFSDQTQQGLEQKGCERIRKQKTKVEPGCDSAHL